MFSFRKKIAETFLRSEFDDYDKYLEIQYRLDPKEFLDSRLKIISSFVYIIPQLEKLGLTKPVKESGGQAKGQLKKNELKILDAGCRDGWAIEFLNDLGYTDVVGLELFDEYVNYCNARNRKAVKGDLHELEFADDSFEFVYCRHVLEHCLDPVKVIEEMLRVLKPGGVMFCNFPLEPKVYGKHTLAFPNPEAVKSVLAKVKKPFKEVFVDRSVKTGVIIPEGDEYSIFIQKI